MGFIKQAKAEAIREHARRAIAEGRSVFACRVNEGITTGTSGPLSGVAEQIEAVESLGWLLDKATFDIDRRGRGAAFLLFRRPRQVAPQGQPPASWGRQG